MAGGIWTGPWVPSRVSGRGDVSGEPVAKEVNEQRLEDRKDCVL